MKALRATLLVTAKAPVPGQVKTRLAADIGDDLAAELAALALLDTLEVGTATFGAARCRLALAGDLRDAVHAGAIARALQGWTIRPQRGSTFNERLVRAHAQTRGPVLQIGMDTPQVTSAHLHAAAACLNEADAVLGPASDGGWWLLGLQDPRNARALAEVTMSTAQTRARTVEALATEGLSVISTDELCDVNTASDADHVSAAAPRTRFAQAWTARQAVQR